MSNEARLAPPLLGLFRALVASGVAVGVRDYLDGLRALQLGFGQPDRQSLRRLAQTLWARSEVEQRLIARWFDGVALPVAALLAGIDEALDAAMPQERETRGAAGPDPAKPGIVADQPPLPLSDTQSPLASAELAERARLSFASAREGGGLPVPRLPAQPLIGEDYVLHPHTLISPREMAVLWRRYRRSTRHGPRTELDIAASIHERSRRSVLAQPVCRPRRSNSARLLVLADVSPSMDPWRPFIATLGDSLRFGRLASAELRYFGNLPRKQLYATPDLADGEASDEVLRRHAGAGLLVVSDAGSARGFLNRRRGVQTADFLAEASRYFPAMVWLNPMPRSRWSGTTAALVEAARNITMLPLDASQLQRGIDILRGNK